MNPNTPKPRIAGLNLVLLLGVAAVLGYYYAGYRVFGSHRTDSAFSWLLSTWNSESGYEHGWFILPAVAFLLWHNWKKIKTEPLAGSNAGLVCVVLGLLLFVVSIRTLQPRIAVGGLPILLFGIVHYLCGYSIARHTMFPLAMIYFAIPLPGLVQATNGLQLLVTKAAYHMASFVGIPVYLSGNQIMLRGGGDFYVDELCSGVRSITALTLIAFVYGYFTHKEKWKRLVVFAASIPVAIAANTLRIFSILVVARTISEDFAKGVYHDYSGYISFAIALGLLLLLSRILNRGLHFSRAKVVVRKTGAAFSTAESDTP